MLRYMPKGRSILKKYEPKWMRWNMLGRQKQTKSFKNRVYGNWVSHIGTEHLEQLDLYKQHNELLFASKCLYEKLQSEQFNVQEQLFPVLEMQLKVNLFVIKLDRNMRTWRKSSQA